MARWYTADHHFGHQKVIEHCSRPFEHAHAMNVEMVQRWNALVSDSDEVWILGDLVWGSSWRTMAGCVARLAGRKVLVPGNHDRCWRGRDNHEARRGDYYSIGGIDDIVDDPEPHVIAGQSVTLNHFPYLVQSCYELKYTEHRPRDDGGWLLHGHVHETWRQSGRQINVGVDAWSFAPVPEDTLAQIIEQGPANRPALDYAAVLHNPDELAECRR